MIKFKLQLKYIMEFFMNYSITCLCGGACKNELAGGNIFDEKDTIFLLPQWSSNSQKIFTKITFKWISSMQDNIIHSINLLSAY